MYQIGLVHYVLFLRAIRNKQNNLNNEEIYSAEIQTNNLLMICNLQ